MKLSERIAENSAEYGLVNHVPSGEVYVMRYRDGAICGPIHCGDHLALMANDNDNYYDPEDAEWAKGEEWQPHNLTGTCSGCIP